MEWMVLQVQARIYTGREGGEMRGCGGSDRWWAVWPWGGELHGCRGERELDVMSQCAWTWPAVADMPVSHRATTSGDQLGCCNWPDPARALLCSLVQTFRSEKRSGWWSGSGWLAGCSVRTQNWIGTPAFSFFPSDPVLHALLLAWCRLAQVKGRRRHDCHGSQHSHTAVQWIQCKQFLWWTWLPPTVEFSLLTLSLQTSLLGSLHLDANVFIKFLAWILADLGPVPAHLEGSVTTPWHTFQLACLVTLLDKEKKLQRIYKIQV